MSDVPQDQKTAKTSAETEWIDEEIRQVHQVHRVGEDKVIAVGFRIESLPEP